MIFAYEEALIRARLITTSFRNIKEGNHEFKLKKFQFFSPFFFCIYFLIRSTLVLLLCTPNAVDHSQDGGHGNVSTNGHFSDSGNLLNNVTNPEINLDTITGSVKPGIKCPATAATLLHSMLPSLFTAIPDPSILCPSEDINSMVLEPGRRFDGQLYLGDYLMTLGVSGQILHSWLVTYSLVGIVFRTVFLVSEYRSHHHFFTDFHPDNYSNLKLNPKNLRMLILHTKVLIFLYKLFLVGIIFSAMSMHSLGYYFSLIEVINKHEIMTASLIVINFTIQFILTAPWLWDACHMFTMTFTTVYLSCTYIKMRFNQLNEVREEPLRAPSLGESEEVMWRFIRDHREITQKVQEYNISIRWVLFCVMYIFAIAMALGFIVIIIGDFSNIWTQGLMLLIGLQQMAFLTIYPVIAGGVDTSATKSYGTLKTIQIANGRHYDSMLDHQLNRLVERMSCDRFRISFYCLDLYPFKSGSTFEFVASTASTVILLLSIFDSNKQ